MEKRCGLMRYLVVVFWAFILGNVAAYIGGALNGASYNFAQASIVSLITGCIIAAIGLVARPTKKQTVTK